MPGVLRMISTANRWIELGSRVKAKEPVNPMELIDLGLHTLFAEDTARDVRSQGAALLNTILFGSQPEMDEPTYDGVPWASFARHLKDLPWGVICVYGDPKYGKTAFAVKQASGWRERRGWKTEGLGFYPDDRPPWIEPVAMSRIIARMRKIGRFLNQEESDAIDDGLTDDDLRGKKKAEWAPPRVITQDEIDRMGRRTVIIDESALFFSSLGGAGQSETRDAAKRWTDQIRHLESIFVFIAQKQSDIPPHVRASALNVYKWASKGVIAQDFKPGSKRDTGEKWLLALTMLQAVKTGSYVEPLPSSMTETMREAIHRAAQAHVLYWAGPLADIRAWGVAMGSIDGHEVLTVFPFTPYRAPELLTVGQDDG